MKLADCDINPSTVSMSPLARMEPEEMWVRGRAKGSIPESLFEIYRSASYLSFGAAPRFLRDKNHVLFSYFCMMLRSLASLLVDIDRENEALIEAEANQYYVGKEIDDPTWTKEKSEAASAQANRIFRNLLISLNGSLDTASELIAIFSQGGIKNLQVGRAQFHAVEVWLRSDFKPAYSILTPRDIYLESLHRKLTLLVHCQSPETEWLSYMRLMRNKVAHLGDGPLRFGRLRGSDGVVYTFSPRVWPYIWEREMKLPGQQNPSDLPKMLFKTLVHQDVVEYMRGAERKVRQVVGEACSATAKACTDFKSFEFNQVGLDQLAQNTTECSFEHFA